MAPVKSMPKINEIQLCIKQKVSETQFKWLMQFLNLTRGNANNQEKVAIYRTNQLTEQ